MNSDPLAALVESRYLARSIAACQGIAFDDSDIIDTLSSYALDHGEKVFSNLSKQQKASANVMFRAVARGITDETMSRVREELLKGIRRASQLPPSVRPRYLRRVLGKLGVYGADKSVVQTVTRTQAAVADSAAVWLETRIDPDVWGYELIAKHDARESHRRMHGVRYPKYHRFWRRYFPPNGWNCRCRVEAIRFGSAKARTKPFVGTPDVDPGFRFNPGVIISGVH